MFEPNQEDLPEFFAHNRVEVVSSLPIFWRSKPTLSAARAYLINP
jgi:hypothetical protein